MHDKSSPIKLSAGPTNGGLGLGLGLELELRLELRLVFPLRVTILSLEKQAPPSVARDLTLTSDVRVLDEESKT